jgi:hypothetical protein
MRNGGQVMVNIDPVPYSSQSFEPIPNSRLEILYHKGILPFDRKMELRFVFRGETQQPAGYYFPENVIPGDEDPTVAKRRLRERPASLARLQRFEGARLPATLTVGNARLTIWSVDPASKAASISIDREPRAFLFRAVYPQVRVIVLPPNRP